MFHVPVMFPVPVICSPYRLYVPRTGYMFPVPVMFPYRYRIMFPVPVPVMLPRTGTTIGRALVGVSPINVQLCQFDHCRTVTFRGGAGWEPPRPHTQRGGRGRGRDEEVVPEPVEQHDNAYSASPPRPLIPRKLQVQATFCLVNDWKKKKKKSCPTI
jgi:hypothetical protein